MKFIELKEVMDKETFESFLIPIQTIERVYEMNFDWLDKYGTVGKRTGAFVETEKCNYIVLETVTEIAKKIERITSCDK